MISKVESKVPTEPNRWARLSKARWLALLGFALAHGVLLWFGWHGIGTPMGDVVQAYLPWQDFMFKTGRLLGLSQSWVYPYPNLIFVLGPALVPGLGYEGNWFVMAIAINLLAQCLLLFWGSSSDNQQGRARRVAAAWLWTAGLLLMGPVSISRLDNISVAVAVIGVVAWLRAKPTVAATWFAIATWIKVWPFVLVAGLALAVKNRLRVLLYGVGTGFLLLVVGLALGNLRSVLGFAFEQQDRSIQIESPWAAGWLWLGVFHVRGFGNYYDMGLQTFQVSGGNPMPLARLLGPAMYLAVAITFALGWLAQRANIDASLRAQIFAWTTLTAVLDLIVFNKVGSPQYYGWLLVPAIMGLLAQVPNWRSILLWLGVLLGLTGLVYPVCYNAILGLNAPAVGLLTLRNLIAIGLLVVANVRLTALAKSGWKTLRER